MSTHHRIRWYVHAGGQLIPHTSSMRGTWGYDARCSCGWESRTGGAARPYVQQLVSTHKSDVSQEASRSNVVSGLANAYVAYRLAETNEQSITALRAIDGYYAEATEEERHMADSRAAVRIAAIDQEA